MILVMKMMKKGLNKILLLVLVSLILLPIFTKVIYASKYRNSNIADKKEKIEQFKENEKVESKYKNSKFADKKQDSNTIVDKKANNNTNTETKTAPALDAESVSSNTKLNQVKTQESVLEPVKTSPKQIISAQSEPVQLVKTKTNYQDYTEPSFKKVDLNELGKNQLVLLINKSRNENGLIPYRLNIGLNNVSTIHSNDMKLIGLKHTEKSLLISRVQENYGSWVQIGENVGVAKNVKLDEAGIIRAVSIIHSVMINEVAPNDGHKKAILSNDFTDMWVSLAIVDNGNGYGTVYVTETFAK